MYAEELRRKARLRDAWEFMRWRWTRSVIFFAVLHLIVVAAMYVYALMQIGKVNPPTDAAAVQMAYRIVLFPMHLLDGTKPPGVVVLLIVVANSVLWGAFLATVYQGVVVGAAYLRERLSS